MARVFITATSPDLDDYRLAAAIAAQAAGFDADMQEPWTDEDHPPLDDCLERVCQADVLVVIAAHCYGWIPEDARRNPDGKSIGWLACDEAQAHAKQVLALVVDDGADWPGDLRDAADLTRAMELDDDDAADDLIRSTRKRIKGLKAFKQWLDSQGLRSPFGSKEGLKQQIEQTLKEWRSHHVGAGLLDVGGCGLDTAADVFISYASEDHAWAERLFDALTAEGWAVWWDRSLRAGQRFDKALWRGPTPTPGPRRPLRQDHQQCAVQPLPWRGP